MEELFNPSLFGGVVAVICFFFSIGLLNTLIRVCSPRQVLVVTGTKTQVQDKEYGFRLQKGGWTLVIPYFQGVQTLDLSIIPVNVRIDGVNSANGITVGADATACVCVDDEDETLLYSAVERLMGKSRAEIQEQIQHTMIGNFRGALNKTTPLQAIGMVESAEDIDQRDDALATVDTEGERAQFRSELLRDSTQDLSTFGMRVVSVSLQRIWDTSNYIANLANKTLSHKRQEVEIEEARLGARAERAESDAQRRETIAVSQASEQILAAQQELEVLRRQCEADIERSRLEADSAVSKATSEGERTVQEITVDLQKLKNRSNVTLEAEVRKQAAEILAAGEGESIRIVQETHNDLLRQKAGLVGKAGDLGKIALFVQQQLSHLFAAYQEHAKGLSVDTLVVMDDKRGFNGVVNRGPEALVDFLHHFEEAFGICVRDLLTASTSADTAEEKAS
ncbi:MAG: SPFH domain-containing protein [Candidatus Tectomicrobia bacterium]